MAAAIEAESAAIQVEPAADQTAQPVDGAGLPSQKDVQNGAPKKPREKRPNYHEIHSKPLPLDVVPLPAFIPHNPLSIVRIAVSLISHSVRRTNSHSVLHKAYYSLETQSVHVTDPASIRALWEQGFWGKGSLSRSEPQWLATEKRRRGAEALKTSAEVTLSRREDRKQFKLERAKAQREAIEQQLRQEGKLDADVSIDELVDDGQVAESPRGTIYTPNAGDIVTVSGDAIVSEISKSLENGTKSWGEALEGEMDEAQIEDLEHLQLTPEEAFFLTYALGVLEVHTAESTTRSSHGTPHSALDLLQIFCAQAARPEPSLSTPANIAPDNPFILNYVVYHHFRSLGWVPRPGVKFAVDYLLYIRGPAFAHAKFGLMIIPSYSHAYWSSDTNSTTASKQKDWWWFFRVNRVQTQAMKTLLLVYVEVPAPWDNSDGDIDIGGILKKYSVREFVFKRWSPNRNRKFLASFQTPKASAPS